MNRFKRMISQWRGRQAVGGLLLTLVTLIGALLRWQTLAEPLWLDELHTGWVVSAQWSDISPRAAAGNQAPAYFYIPWLSTKLGGPTPLALRLPSLLAGILVIPGSGWLVWRWTRSSVAGLLVATLMAIDRDFVFYGAEARVYAMLQFVGLIHIAAFLSWQRHAAWKSRAVWLGTGVLLFYLHYTTLLVIAGEFLMRLVGLVRNRWVKDRPSTSARSAARWFELLVDLALFTLAVLPAVAHLAEVAARRGNWSALLSADRLSTIFPWGPCLVAPLLCVGLVALLWRVRGQSPTYRRRPLRAAWPLVGALFVPVLAAMIATEMNQAQLLRYRYLILPATLLPLLAGLIVASAPSRWWNRGIAVIVLLFAFPASELAIRLKYDVQATAARRENWPAAIDLLNHDAATTSWPVLLCGGLVEDRQLLEAEPPSGWESRDALVAFCRFPLRSTYVLRRPDQDILPLPTSAERRTDPAIHQRIKTAGGAWLVVRGGKRPTTVIADSVRDELLAAGIHCTVDAIEEFGGVTVVRLVLS